MELKGGSLFYSKELNSAILDIQSEVAGMTHISTIPAINPYGGEKLIPVRIISTDVENIMLVCIGSSDLVNLYSDATDQMPVIVDIHKADPSSTTGLISILSEWTVTDKSFPQTMPDGTQRQIRLINFVRTASTVGFNAPVNHNRNPIIIEYDTNVISTSSDISISTYRWTDDSYFEFDALNRGEVSTDLTDFFRFWKTLPFFCGRFKSIEEMTRLSGLDPSPDNTKVPTIDDFGVLYDSSFIVFIFDTVAFSSRLYIKDSDGNIVYQELLAGYRKYAQISLSSILGDSGISFIPDDYLIEFSTHSLTFRDMYLRSMIREFHFYASTEYLRDAYLGYNRVPFVFNDRSSYNFPLTNLELEVIYGVVGNNINKLKRLYWRSERYVKTGLSASINNLSVRHGSEVNILLNKKTSLNRPFTITPVAPYSYVDKMKELNLYY